MDLNNPFRVTTEEGVKLLVMNSKDPLPTAFALMGTTAREKVAVRVMGGCSNMSAENKTDMLNFFAEGFRGFAGVILSGGTRATTEDGQIDPMVTDVPGYIASKNPGSVALGTAPRTDIMRLKDNSRLVFDEWNVPNPSMSAILVVQENASDPNDWDGDVETYFKLMADWQTHGQFTALAGVVWNGGGVTKDEANECARRGWPTILVRGSGRGADEIIAKLEAGDEETVQRYSKSGIIVDKNNPNELRDALVHEGVI